MNITTDELVELGFTTLEQNYFASIYTKKREAYKRELIVVRRGKEQLMRLIGHIYEKELLLKCLEDKANAPQAKHRARDLYKRFKEGI